MKKLAMLISTKHRQNYLTTPQMARTLLASEHHRPQVPKELQSITPRLSQRLLGLDLHAEG